MGKGSANLTDPHHTPTIIQPSTQPQKNQKPRKPKRKDTRVPHPSDPSDNVADEAVYKELGDGPTCQETIGDTIAQTRFENVSKLSNDSLLAIGKDASKQRRINAIDADEDIILVNVQDDTDEEMYDVGTVTGDEVFAELDVAAKDVNLTIDEVALAQALIALKSVKPKVKGDVIEEPNVPVNAASALTKVSAATTTNATSPTPRKGFVITELSPLGIGAGLGRGLLIGFGDRWWSPRPKPAPLPFLKSSSGGGGSSSRASHGNQATMLLRRLKEHKNKRARSDPLLSSDYERYVHSDFVTMLQTTEFETFDVLGFWKAKETMFPVLSRMAMDILSAQAASVASESAFSTSERVLSIRRTRLTPASLEMCMCLKDHLNAQERKLDKSTFETPVDFEEEVLDAEVQVNEAIPLSDEEIALDAASSECSMSGPGSGGEEAEAEPNYSYDVYNDDY
ncbi:zinc finger BED domain-containing protein RICESLEEPER 2 [Tanacetum coccineum]